MTTNSNTVPQGCYKIEGGEEVDEATAKKREKAARARAARKAKDAIMRSCGLTKVRGSVSGRTYWE